MSLTPEEIRAYQVLGEARENLATIDRMYRARMRRLGALHGLMSGFAIWLVIIATRLLL